uniref:Uncharacterized protein n=1 Tax=Anguilla anguilla TaxID=7936 RepID=A0A0E9PXV7_ANGAN
MLHATIIATKTVIGKIKSIRSKNSNVHKNS